MMKLVEILARELEVWPVNASKKGGSVTQDANFLLNVADEGKIPVLNKEGTAWTASTCSWAEDANGDEIRVSLSTDHATAIVTRADWESERAKLKAPKANGDGWIRHRGQSDKCPVAKGTIVRIKDRSGDIYTCEASGMRWDHIGSGGDIMRYKIHKPAEHAYVRDGRDIASDPNGILIVNPRDTVKAYKPAEQPCPVEAKAAERLATLDPAKTVSLEEMEQRFAGPLEWRDRIRELDAQRAEVESTYQRQISEITQERESLVQKLAGEGLALVEVVVQPVEDMSDWRNWRVGDLVKLADKVCEETGMEPGSIGNISELDYNDRRGHNVKVDGWYWPLTENLTWVSRPAS